MDLLKDIKMKKETLVFASILGLGLAAPLSAAPKWAKKGTTIVKCKGVAKKGGNDCGANGHGCGGQAKKDRDANEWVYVPEGVCNKIAGGKVLKKVKVK